MKFSLKPRLKLPRIRHPSIKITNQNIQELALLAGFLMILKGLYMIYPPLMWILGGLYLMLPTNKTTQKAVM
ncbi:MAG: hypothetical protein ABFD18_06295 [Syntrophomonas sp.]